MNERERDRVLSCRVHDRGSLWTGVLRSIYLSIHLFVIFSCRVHDRGSLWTGVLRSIYLVIHLVVFFLAECTSAGLCGLGSGDLSTYMSVYTDGER